MVATVRNSKKRNSRKSPPKKQLGGWQTKIIFTTAAIIIIMLGASLWKLNTAQNTGKPAAGTSVTVTKKDTPQPQKTVKTKKYQYTEILGKRSVDTGSGVTVTRDYEAEKIARDNARRKALAEKKKKLEEEQRRSEAEKNRIAEEKRRLAEDKRRLEMEKRNARNQKNSNIPESSRNINNSNDIKKLNPENVFIECASDTYRTEAQAEKHKAELAFRGKESRVIHKKVGGGYVYSILIGPLNNLDEGKKVRNEIVNAKLGNNCTIK